MRLIVACVALAALAACGHQITHGTVQAKAVHPEHDAVILMPITTVAGKAIITTLIPLTFHYPEAYSLDVRGTDKRGQERVEQFWVSAEEYAKTQRGDTYSCGEIKDCVRDQPREEKH